MKNSLAYFSQSNADRGHSHRMEWHTSHFLKDSLLTLKNPQFSLKSIFLIIIYYCRGKPG